MNRLLLFFLLLLRYLLLFWSVDSGMNYEGDVSTIVPVKAGVRTECALVPLIFQPLCGLIIRRRCSSKSL